MARPSSTRLALVLGSAILAISLAAIFIRLADAPGLVVAAYRMLLAGLAIVPFTVRGLRRTPLTRAMLGPTLLAGLLLAGHFATWITALSYTTVTAAVTLVTTTPVWVALFGWVFLGLSPTLSVLLGLLLAVAGGAVIGFGDLNGGSAPLLGDALALAGAVFGAGYLLLGRSVQRRGLGLDAYVGVAYGVAALALLPVPLIAGLPYLGYDLPTLGWIAGLALVPQLIGHTGLNYVMRYLDPTLVATTTLLEPVGAALLALLIFAEIPSRLTVIGALLMLLGIVLVSRTEAGRSANRLALDPSNPTGVTSSPTADGPDTLGR